MNAVYCAPVSVPTTTSASLPSDQSPECPATGTTSAATADATAIRFETDQTRGIGTRFVCDTKVGPITLQDHMEITEWEPQRRMGVRHTGVVTGTGSFELTPIDLVSAYGTLGNGGKRIPPTTILSVNDRAGKPVADPYTPPEGTQVVSPQAAWIVTDILSGNTNRRINPFWGEFAITGPGGDRRPATLKTGTNNDAKDLNAYGYIAPPTEEGRKDGAYALAVGAWNGNSDNTPVSTPDAPVFSIDVSTFVWQGFLQEASAEWEITAFERPDGLNRVAIDPFTGLLPAAGQEGVPEWFIGDSAPIRFT